MKDPASESLVETIPIPVQHKPILQSVPGPTLWEDNEEIKIFREYLQIPSVHPNVDYGELCFFFIEDI